MKKLFLLLPIFLFADIDPFSAGLNSNYGLTPEEKAILNNKKEISKLKLEISNINDTLDKINLKLSNYDDVINQKLSAFSTLVDELKLQKAKIVSLENNLTLQNSNIQKLEDKINSIESEIKSIKESIKEITQIQNENFNTLKDAIAQILETIKKQNRPLSAKEAFYKAKQLFFDGKLSEAKKYFLYSLNKKYLPATSSYYLGEIAFKQKRYKEALAYYKKSITFYPKKTSFTARLLYHTAISFLKIGDKESAKLTFNKLINDFPDSKYANLAKKELEKL